MEAIIFCGIQATGKSSFYKEHFFKTHVRISLDLLKTRHREEVFIEACLSTKQPYVIDNTNPTVEERAKYITVAKSAGFKIIGYYFQSKFGDAIARNAARSGKEQVPVKAIGGTYKRLQVPSMDEGFDALYYVTLGDEGFAVQEWSPDEV